MSFNLAIGAFLSRLTVGDECWEWRGSVTTKGYGRFKVKGKHYSAHRFSYSLLKEAIPPGLVIDHLCRNKKCVRPDHLEAVTDLENIQRGEAGLANLLKESCPQKHSYSADNTWLDKQGYRHCKTCNRERQKARRNAI